MPRIMDKIKDPSLTPKNDEEIKEFVEAVIIASARVFNLPVFEISATSDSDTFAYNTLKNRLLVNYKNVKRESWKETLHGTLHEIRHSFQYSNGGKFNDYIGAGNILRLLTDQSDYLKDEEIMIIKSSVYRLLMQVQDEGYFRESILDITMSPFSELHPSTVYNAQHDESDANKFAVKIISLLDIEYP